MHAHGRGGRGVPDVQASRNICDMIHGGMPKTNRTCLSRSDMSIRRHADGARLPLDFGSVVVRCSVCIRPLRIGSVSLSPCFRFRCFSRRFGTVISMRIHRRYSSDQREIITLCFTSFVPPGCIPALVQLLTQKLPTQYHHPPL